MWRRVAKPNYGKTGTGETLKKSFQLIVWRGFSLNQRFSTLRARNTRGSQIFKVLNVHWNDIFWPFFTKGIRQFLFYLTPMKKAGNTCSKAVFFNLFWFAAPLQSYVDVAGNWGNQAFPEIPRHFWKCLGNWGNSGIA